MPQQSSSRKRSQSAPIDNAYGHLQPQALEIEAAVLGAMMIDKDAFSMVSELLSPDTFYDKRNSYVFSAIQTLALAERPVDVLTVIEQMKKDGTIAEVGGPAYIIDLNANVASSANLEYHALILQHKYMGRQLISFASGILTKAYDDTIDVDELMQQAEGELFELSQRNMSQDYTQIDPVLKQARLDIEKASEKSGGLSGLASGYTKLDEMTSGWQPSDLIIIAGRPAMGKTSFALSMAKNMVADYQIPVAFFSLEMNNVQLVNRLISNVCEISGSRILSGNLGADGWERFDKNIGKLEGAPLYVDDTPGLSVFELRSKARRLKKEKDIQMIMIDYLQLMNANGMRFNSRQEEVSTISRSLKGLAKELNIPIVALSQLNRGVEGREGNEGKRPMLSDLRESGAIEQDADMVLFVHRPEYYRIYEDSEGNDMRGMAQIIIAKHRKGAVGDVNLRFRGEFTRFENPADNSYADSLGEIVGSKINGHSMGGDIPIDDVPPFAQPLPDVPF